MPRHSFEERFHEYSRKTRELILRGLRALETIYKVLITNRRWFAVISAAAEDFWAKKMYYYTGNFTYNAFLAIIALLVALSALIGLLASSASLSEEFAKTLKSVVPIFGTTPQKTLDAMKTYRGVAGVVGLVGLVWTGTKIFGAMEWGFCEIWGSRRRNFAKKKVFGALLISIIGLLFLGAFLVQFGFNALWEWAVGSQGTLYDIGSFVAKPLVGFVVNFLLFLVIYKIVPTMKLKGKNVLIGAAGAAAAFLTMQYLVAFYFGSISKVPSVYGSLSTVIILLLWLHITGLIVFFGMEVVYVMENDALLEEHRRRATEWSFLPRAWRQAGAEEQASTGPPD